MRVVPGGAYTTVAEGEGHHLVDIGHLVNVDQLFPKFVGYERLKELEGHSHERRSMDDVGGFEIFFVLALQEGSTRECPHAIQAL